MKASLLFSALFLISTSIFSQSDLEKDNEVTISIGLASTKIKNSNLSKDDHLTIDDKNGVNFSFEYSKYLKNRIGFGFGLGCSTYGQEYEQKGFYQLVGLTDKDGYTYDKLISSNVEYSNKLTYFNVPLTIHLILGSSPTFYGFVDAGIVNQFLIKGIYTEEGSIETMAKYPDNTNPYWYYYTQNNPYYDLRNRSVSKEDKERYKFYNLSGHLAIGLAAGITEKLFLRASPFMDYGFSDIMGKDGKGKDYENVLGQKSEYKETKLFSWGINVGFAFNL
jgi:hypothetical protein